MNGQTGAQYCTALEALKNEQVEWCIRCRFLPTVRGDIGCWLGCACAVLCSSQPAIRSAGISVFRTAGPHFWPAHAVRQGLELALTAAAMRTPSQRLHVALSAGGVLLSSNAYYVCRSPLRGLSADVSVCLPRSVPRALSLSVSAVTVRTLCARHSAARDAAATTPTKSWATLARRVLIRHRDRQRQRQGMATSVRRTKSCVL